MLTSCKSHTIFTLEVKLAKIRELETERKLTRREVILPANAEIRGGFKHLSISDAIRDLVSYSLFSYLPSFVILPYFFDLVPFPSECCLQTLLTLFPLNYDTSWTAPFSTLRRLVLNRCPIYLKVQVTKHPELDTKVSSVIGDCRGDGGRRQKDLEIRRQWRNRSINIQCECYTRV